MSLSVQPSSRARWLAFAVLCAMQLMVVIDISIVTVSLRSIRNDLGFGQAQLAWITNAYTAGFGGLLLLSGRLGDLLGRKRMFVGGLGLFTVASAACGAAQSQEMLIAMRLFQGAGAAMAYAVITGIIFAIFTDPREIGRALGISGFAQAAGASGGILAGGLITQGITWHWVFYINVPIGIVAGVLATRLIPGDRGLGLRAGADVAGALLVTVGMMLSVYTIATVGDHGWSSAHTLGFGLASILLLASFVRRQRSAAVPLMPLGIFRSRNLAGANLIHLLLVAGTISFNILIALHMQEVAGYSPAVTGFAFLPLAVIAGVVSISLSARWNMRFGLRTVLLAGLAVVAVGLILVVRVPADPRYVVDILPTALLIGAGSGLAMPAVLMLSMQVDSPRDAGLASGLAGTAGTIGDSLGIAALASIAAARTNTLLSEGESATYALNGGFRLAFGISAALVVGAAAIAFLVLRPQPASPPPQGPPAPEQANPEEAHPNSVLS
ncbi:MFS transporter [Streptomyces sp. NPDC057136]|uniref:MFS transporter n=1 Tax=Streptomyces sp. NPDC057136 TaxID=3346029 RepID=UPI0036421C3B